MGNVSGRLEDGPSLYLRDQWRLSITSLRVANAHNRTVLRVSPNAFPSTVVSARKDAGDDGLVEFVQDPDPTSLSPFLLKLSNDDELHLTFTFNIRRKEDAAGATSVDTIINGLTFISASNARELDNLVTREFHADPNLHKNPNVNLVGDYSTNGSPAVQFEWTWRWKPAQGAEEKGTAGWRNTCSFVEYDQRNHRLSTLAQFSFWVQNKQRLWPPSPAIGPDYTQNNTLIPQMRVNSYNKAVDSEGLEEPASPLLDNSDGSTLAPSIVGVPPVKVDNCPRPADNSLGEDGPLFRATIKSLEQKTGTLRAKMKKVLKRAEQARAAQMACNDAFSAFMESLRDTASAGNVSGIQPALDHYFERTYREILQFERQNEANIQKLIIDPLTKLYHLDLKQAEAKKRDFEDESRDYYSYVGRYLGIRNDSAKEKKKAESESKYQAKRKNFELKRFDYSTFMQDLHGGRKEQEVLAQLTKFADAQARSYLNTAKRVQELMPELEALNAEVRNTAKEFQLQRTEREERRRLLEKSNQQYIEPDVPSFIPPTNVPYATTATPSEILGHNTGFERLGVGTSSLRAVSSGSEGGPEGTFSPPVSSSAPPATMTSISKYRTPLDKEFGSPGTERGESERRKEGLLWALSRPGSHADPKGLNKQAWHKYWVVLAGGQLCEYANWKQKLDLHNEPINLKMASVREARNSDRRFCFEIVTPQYKRVYQATSEEDMNTWILAIKNAVKSTIESGGSLKNFDTYNSEHDSEPAQLKHITTALTGKSPHHHHSVHSSNPMSSSNALNNNVYRRTTVGARPTNVRRNSSNFGDDPEKLLQMVREADTANGTCADCGSSERTEWVSINLGIVLCIECSGLHRSLGTHISKVRSLTLDVTSFTPDLVELLCQVGNRHSNLVWEARLDPTTRPSPKATRDARHKFIMAKYDQRVYVEPLSTTLSLHASANEVLLDAVKKNDIPTALYAIALRADPNYLDPASNMRVVILALASADPIVASGAERDFSSVLTSNSPPMTFPLAELLLQNGGDIPFPLITEGLPLSPAAKNYLNHKSTKGMMNRSAPLPPSSNAGNGDSPSSLRERQQRDKERLQKRVSSGARIHRAPPLDR